MQYNTLLTRIAADIYSNGAELITGDILQNVLNDMVGALASAGACYKGTITPASAAPLDLDQPTVYLALTAGTYTNFVDSNNDPIVTTGPALITYDGGPSLVFSKTDLPSGGSSATVIDTTGKNYLVFDWGAQNLGCSLLVTLKTSSGSRNRSLILDLDVYGDYVAKAADLDGAVELLGDTDFVYDNGTGAGYLTISNDVIGATLRLLSGTLPTISAESSAPEYYGPVIVPVAPYGGGKWGVISQTQTWSGSNATGYDYTMSDIVDGLIPQSFIDAVTNAGATFNSVTGYFELNDLTDISYQEMIKIYNYFLFLDTYAQGDAFITPRTLFPAAKWITLTTSWGRYFTGIETLSFTRTSYNYVNLTNAQITFLFYTGVKYIKKLCQEIRCQANTTFGVGAWGDMFSLETLYLYNLHSNISFASSPKLSPASVSYMINNAGTATFTITLHATAYARANADADVQAALSAHTNVSLASA